MNHGHRFAVGIAALCTTAILATAGVAVLAATQDWFIVSPRAAAIAQSASLLVLPAIALALHRRRSRER